MLRKGIAGRFLRTTMLSGAAMAATSVAAYAQDVGDDRIIVTGSRIARDANLEAPTAVTTIGQEALTYSGETNLSSILRQIPSFGVSGISATNSNFTLQSGGINTLELRNLGEDRTLVLQNGRRIVGGLPGTNIVDFNLIPVDLIERVEVVTGGASSIYGSDALAGVINVILKDDFEGVQFTSQYGQSWEYGDNEEYSFRLTVGGNFADGRGNAVLSAEYVNNKGIQSANRPDTQIDDLAFCYVTNNPLNCQYSLEPFFSSFGEGGRFIIDDDNGTPMDLNDDTSANYNPDGSGFVTGVNGFNRQQYRTIAVPIERWGLSALADYDIHEGENSTITAFIEGTYGSSFTATLFEPVPLDSADIFGGLPMGYDIDNPFVPDALRAIALAGGDDNIAFVRRTTEIGPRGNEALRETFRLVTGLKGTLYDEYNWEAYVNYGRTSRSQESTASLNANSLRYALDAEIDPDTGLPRCVDEVARLQGCVPINFFGVGAVSQAAADYVRHVEIINARIEQTMVGGTFSGPVPGLELPAGSVQFALGAEWRREFSDNQPDGLQQAGLAIGNAIPGNRGQFEVYDLFGELDIPLIKDQAFFEDLSIGGAYRFSDYSTVGTTHAYSANASWSPHQDLRFRFQYARAVRAPNVGELFDSGTENFATVADPCNNLNAQMDATIVATCLQDPLVAQRVNLTGDFVLTQPEIQGTGGFSGTGNPNLDPEIGKSYNAGMVFTHDFGAGGDLAFSVDYFNIEVTGFIAQPGRQFTLDQCYGSGDFANNEFCGFIVRDPLGVPATQGEITDVNTGVVNSGFFKTAGIDFSVLHTFDLSGMGFVNDTMSKVPGFEDGGILSFRANYTWLRKYESEIFGAFEDDLGEVGAFKHEVLAGATYQNGPFSFSWDTQWMSNATIDDEGFFDFYVGDYFRHDLQARYALRDGAAELYFGINNVTDAEPPRILSGVPGNATGTDTQPEIYDVYRRSFYAGMRVKF